MIILRILKVVQLISNNFKHFIVFNCHGRAQAVLAGIDFSFMENALKGYLLSDVCRLCSVNILRFVRKTTAKYLLYRLDP